LEESVTFLKGTDQDELSLHGTECASLVFLAGGPLIGLVGVYNVNDAPQNVASSPVQLTVGYNTTLLLNVTRDFDSTRHVFTCTLLSDGSVVTSPKTITLKLNSTVYSNTTTDGVAKFMLYLTPPTGGNLTYNVVASFNGDSASTATATMTTLNGTTYDVCTTTQYNTLEPSSNSTAITVTPQTTLGATTLMNPAQMQADAETKGLNAWGPDSFSIFPPFFKMHARVMIPSLGVNINSWIGLFGAGVDSMDGIGTSLQTAFENVSLNDVINTAVVAALTATTTLFVASIVAASLSSWNPALIIPVTAAYWALGTLMLLYFNAWSDVYASRLLLTVVAATLRILLIGAYAPGALGGGILSAGSLWFIILRELTASDTASAAVKSLVNAIVLNFFVGATPSACFVAFRANPLMNFIARAQAVEWRFACQWQGYYAYVEQHELYSSAVARAERQVKMN
jgi:hypothetical protein